MNKLFEILSNREIALLFWSMVLLGFIFSKKEVRESVLNVFKVLFTPTILIINLLLFDYVLLLIDLLQRAKFWEVALTKDTIIWTFGIAIILTYNAVTARKLEYFKRIVKDVVKWVVVLEFIINFYSFNILTEIIILPILVFIVLLQAYASLKPEHKKVESVMKAMNAIFGFGFLFFTIYKMITIPGELFTFVSLKSFLLPVLLTILFVPFIYLLALYSHYESLFIRLKFLEKEKPLRKSLKWQILKVANINLNKLSNISGGIAKLLLVDKIRSFDEIKKISKDTRL